MNSPRMSEWYMSSEGKSENYDWTEECQGVTSDGQYWYFPSNNNSKRGIYKMGFKNFSFVDFFPTDGYGDHIGDIDYYNGWIYAPFEPTLQVLMITPDFQSSRMAHLQGADGGPPPQKEFPWCAINPWNSYLYSSDFYDVAQINSYDPNDNFIYKGSLKLQVPLKEVQGGCFSQNGHLYLSSSSSNDIRGYSVLNGAYLGSAAIQVDTSWNVAEEVEGMTIFIGVFNGKPTQVHVILLDNDKPDPDDIFLKHYTVPSPEDL